MCVRQYEIKVPFGVVTAADSMVTNIIEKPTQVFFVNAGIYVLDADLVRNVSRDTSIDMPTLLNNQIAAGKPVAMFPIHEYWLDIGQKEDFDQAQLDYIRDFM
jgi:NDP-sugar pyrophosphorylase family protein